MDDEQRWTRIPSTIFSDDDGSADARLAQALIRHSRGRAPLTDVVDALAYARVLIPVVADGQQRHVGRHGLEQDAVASTGVVAVQMPDGRAALPVFTDVDAMSQWSTTTRPIPAEGPRAALAAIAEGWSALVVNPGLETVVIPRPALWALGQGDPWSPAVVDGVVDGQVAADVENAIGLDETLPRVAVVAGTATELTVVLYLAPGLTQPEVDAVVARVQTDIAHLDVIAHRVDSLELRLAQA